MDLARVTRLLLGDAIKTFVSPQKKFLANDRRRSIEFLIQPVRRQLFQLVGLLVSPETRGHFV